MVLLTVKLNSYFNPEEIKYENLNDQNEADLLDKNNF